MNDFIARDILKADRDLETATAYVKKIMDNDPGEIISKGHNHSLTELLQTTQKVCETLKLKDSKYRAEMLIGHLRFEGRNASAVHTDFHGLWLRFVQELRDVHFAYIPPEKLEYFEQANLFGEVVYDNLAPAREEIKCAGNCLAADLHTAAVFHLMRIVEIGLRELARSLNVRLKKTPLDYAGWESVVKAIDEKLATKIPKSRGPKKTAALKFKQDLLADFKAFEVARNEVMHCRWRCTEQEAKGLYIRVGEFVRKLAIAFSGNKTMKKKNLQSLLGTGTFASKAFGEMLSTIGDFSDLSKLRGTVNPPNK